MHCLKKKVFFQFKTISSITLVVNKFSFVKSIAYLPSLKILLFKRKIKTLQLPVTTKQLRNNDT